MRRKILAALLTVTLTFGFDASICFAGSMDDTLNTEAEEATEGTEENEKITEATEKKETKTEPAKEQEQKQEAELVEEAAEEPTEEQEAEPVQEPEQRGNVPPFISGVIPDDVPAISIHDENEDAVPATQSVQLPAQYDSRVGGYITAVRDQNPFGTCWTFGAMASGEASLLKKGLATADSLDLSERHLAYFFYHPVADPLGNTTGDTITPIGDNYLNLGGNNLFTTFALAAWKGAAAEQTAPYSDLVTSYDQMDLTPAFFAATDLPENLAYTDAYHMQNSFWIPMTDRDDVKKMLMEYGAMSISYYHDDDFLNYDTNAYYSTYNSINHVVSIVGWDDNYSRNNFQAGCQPQNDGAWLARNSWNTWFGDGGYFWISYEDGALNQDLSKGFVFDFESGDNYDNNYQYDGSAGSRWNYMASGGSIGNIFEASANPEGTETLEAVSFALYDTNVNYSIQVYRNLRDRTNPTSGEPALSKPVTGKTSYVGYYTVPLGKALTLKENSLYSVVVQLTKENGEEVQYMVDSTYQNGNWIEFNNAVSPGQSFEKDTADGSWEDLSNAHQNWDSDYDYWDEIYCSARLKAFTNNSSVRLITDITFDKAAMTLSQGKTYTFKPTITPSGIENAEIIWTSSNSKVASVDAKGKVTAKAGGTATITATANDGSGKKASCKITVPYKITYKLNGGKNSSANPSGYYNKQITLKNPTRAGYTFRGWYTDSTYTNKLTTITSGYKKNLTLYARWTKNSLTLTKTTLKLKKNKSYGLGAKVSFGPSSAKVVWISSNKNVATVSSRGTVTAKGMGTANITATLKDAKGIILKDAYGRTMAVTCKVTVPYTITYDLNGGKNSSSNPTTYYKQKISLKSPVRSGYTFKGWYTDSKYKNRITSISSSSRKNLTLHAKWSRVAVNKSSIKYAKNSKAGQMIVSYKAVSGAYGYQITYSTNKSFTSKKSVTSKTEKVIIKSLRKGKTYYVKVQAFKRDSAGKNVFGKYSTAKKIKITK